MPPADLCSADHARAAEGAVHLRLQTTRSLPRTWPTDPFRTDGNVPSGQAPGLCDSFHPGASQGLISVSEGKLQNPPVFKLRIAF